MESGKGVVLRGLEFVYFVALRGAKILYPFFKLR